MFTNSQTGCSFCLHYYINLYHLDHLDHYYINLLTPFFRISWSFNTYYYVIIQQNLFVHKIVNLSVGGNDSLKRPCSEK